MRQFIFTIVLTLFMALMLPLPASAKEVTSYTLPNGLQVFVQEDHRAPVAVLQVWYKVGSSYEPNGITGISHALEHMMFQGTAKHGRGEFSRILSDVGAQLNAMTGTDYTLYYELMDSRKLAIAFELEADRMRNINLTPEEFAKEMQVVMEERRMRFEDNPQSFTYERLVAATFISTSYHHLPIGWMNDIKNLKLHDLQQWYQQWYAPNNAFIVVVGDVKPQEIYQLALQYFGPLKSAVLPEIKPQVELPSVGQRSLVTRLPAQVPWVLMAYNVPSVPQARQSNDPYVLAVIAAILGSGSNSWLNKDLIRGSQIAADAQIDYDPYQRLSTAVYLQGTPAPGRTSEEIKTGLITEIKKLQDTLVLAEELARVKTGVIASKVYSQDVISHQAEEIGSLIAVGLPWQLRDEFVQRIAAVTPAQIQEVARHYFIPENLTVAELQPLPLEKGQKPAQAPAAPGEATHVH